MTQFTYRFCVAVLHSFWQAALLLLLFVTIEKILLRNNSPLPKRNFLAIRAPPESISTVQFFLINPVKCPIDDMVTAIFCQLVNQARL